MRMNILMLIMSFVGVAVHGFEPYPDKARWAKTEITWSTDNEAYTEAATAAFASWSRATGGHLTFVKNDSPLADIRITDASDLDGNGFFGFCYLVRNKRDPAQIKLESALIEVFTVNPNVFHATLLHEIGHALGLDHCDIERAVMFDEITSTKTTLFRDDVEGICSLYGLPVPVAPDIFVGVTRIKGKTYLFESSEDVRLRFDVRLKFGRRDYITTGEGKIFDVKLVGRYPITVIAEQNGWEKTIVIEHPKKRKRP